MARERPDADDRLMPISPTAAGGDTYSAAGTKSLVATVSVPLWVTRTLVVTFPGPAAGADVKLLRSGPSLPLMPAAISGIDDTSTFFNRRVEANAVTAGNVVTLTIRLTDISGTTNSGSE